MNIQSNMLRLLVAATTTFLLCLNTAHAQPFLRSPIQGVYGKDFYIINYVDEDTAALKFKDHHCGTKSYDGHYGTDFVIRDYKQMDSGVKVIACAPGRVFKIVDTAFDRNTTSIPSLAFGNYIGIWHVIGGRNYYTYYAHIKKNSHKVDSGSVVTVGQELAEVACSGDCASPHVHLEVWTDSVLVDPFAGNCKLTSPSTNYWIDSFEYDSTFAVIQNGMYNNVLSYDQIRERPTDRQSYTYPSDTAITLWFEAKGIRLGDSLVAEWYTPSGTLWYRFGTQSDGDYWLGWWWSTINHPKLFKGVDGTWSVKFLRNGIEQFKRNFTVQSTADVAESRTNTGLYVQLKGEDVIVSSSTMNLENGIVQLYDVMGRAVQIEQRPKGMQSLELHLLHAERGCYYLRVSDGRDSEVIKLYLGYGFNK